MFLFGIMFAIDGLFIALKYKEQVARISSAFLGTYVFIMSCNLFTGGIPDAPEMWMMITGEEEIDIEKPFWIYVGVSLLTFLGTAYFQFPRKENPDDFDRL